MDRASELLKIVPANWCHVGKVNTWSSYIDLKSSLSWVFYRAQVQLVSDLCRLSPKLIFRIVGITEWKRFPKAGIIRRGFQQRRRNVIEEERCDLWVKSGSWKSRWFGRVSLEEVWKEIVGKCSVELCYQVQTVAFVHLFLGRQLSNPRLRSTCCGPHPHSFSFTKPGVCRTAPQSRHLWSDFVAGV